MLTKRQVVKTQVNERAALHVRNTRGPSQFDTLLIRLDRTGERAQLPVKPAVGIGADAQ